MPEPTFDQLLIQADASAQAAQWQAALDDLSLAHAIRPSHAGVVSGLGTCLLQLGQPAQALPYFRQAADLEPASPDAQNNLAVAYMLAGELSLAERACRQALTRDADHLPAWRNLALACLRQGRAQEGVSILGAIVKTHPADIESLLVLASCYARGGELKSARFLYARVLQLQPGQAEAAAALSALDPPTEAPRPAASHLARQEHVAKLARLTRLRLASAPNAPVAPAATPTLQTLPSVAFYGPNEVSLGVRVGVPASALHQAGHRVTAGLLSSTGPLGGYDVYVFSRPQLLVNVLQHMAVRHQSGGRVVVDLDDDFHHLPPDHPGYREVGPGNPASLRVLEQALGLADLLVVATPLLAERYAPYARRVAVLPNGWSAANPLWNRSPARRATVNIGWAGTMTHRTDFGLVRSALVRLARELPQVQVVIGGDPAIYESLSALPEPRRLFLPMASFEDYPYLLSYFDILVAPLSDNPFNQAKSDIKLLEAGVRRIPWVASPRAAYQAWAEGGLLAESADEWHTALRHLVTDVAARRALGEAGRAKAETRESQQLCRAWQDALTTLMAAPIEG